MKKTISLLLAAIMLMSLMSLTVSAAFGDANEDNATNAKDLALLQQYVAGWDVTLDPVTADITGDGDVNAQDVAILQQYLAGWNLPANVTLPAIGTDIDVAKKKDRIRVSAASATMNNSSNTITVSLTFKNYTRNWITEETNWVEYTCYDANGNVVKSATKIYIGCIDTKINPEKTFSFTVPSNTAEVKLTNSKIVYWTEWA